MKLIVITGTPGTGKSTLAVKLAKELGFDRLDISKHYKTLSVGYNTKKQCFDVDVAKLEELVQEKLKSVEKGLIVDSHIAHLLPKVDICVVLTCSNLKMLEKRLLERGYSPQKIRENLDAEIFQVCLVEAKEKHEVIEVNTGKLSKEQVLEKVTLLAKKLSRRHKPHAF
jgi:adenylate kinase